MTSMSVNVIARNGEKDLAELIPMVKPFADEVVVVVDDRTTDNTIEVAKSLGATPHLYKWTEGFKGARNFAIEHSTKDYIVWFDCDDRIRDISPLMKFKAENDKPNVIYTFKVANVTKEGNLSNIHFNQVRMFPRHPDVRFVYRIHETISHEVVNKGFTIAPLDLIVDHHGYKEKHLYQEKLQRNIPEIVEEIKSGSFCPTLKYTYAMNLISVGYVDQAMHWLRHNINDEVKNSPFRDVYLFSILNVCKILINKRLYAEAEYYLIKGMLSLPDFKEYHLLRAHISFFTGDINTATIALANAKRCPIRGYAISTDWDLIDQQCRNFARSMNIDYDSLIR